MAGRQTRRRTGRRAVLLVAVLAGLCGAAAFAAYLVWANTFPRGPLFDPIAELPDPLPRAEAELNARRVAVAFEDAQALWQAYVEREFDRPWRPARLELFTRSTRTPCAPGLATAGPFYCAAEATVAYDLLFSEALARRLRRDVETGTTLIVARMVAAHARAQLGRTASAPLPPRDPVAGALALDCLAGVWVNLRARRIGPVAPGFYGRLVQTARNTSGDLGRVGPGIAATLDPFRTGSVAAREAAFQTGYRTGETALCSEAAILAAAG